MFSKFTLALWFWWIICPGFNGLLCIYIYIVEKKKNITQIINWEEKRRIDIIFIPGPSSDSLWSISNPSTIVEKSLRTIWRHIFGYHGVCFFLIQRELWKVFKSCNNYYYIKISETFHNSLRWSSKPYMMINKLQDLLLKEKIGETNLYPYLLQDWNSLCHLLLRAAAELVNQHNKDWYTVCHLGFFLWYKQNFCLFTL